MVFSNPNIVKKNPNKYCDLLVQNPLMYIQEKKLKEQK